MMLLRHFANAAALLLASDLVASKAFKFGIDRGEIGAGLVEDGSVGHSFVPN